MDRSFRFLQYVWSDLLQILCPSQVAAGGARCTGDGPGTPPEALPEGGGPGVGLGPVACGARHGEVAGVEWRGVSGCESRGGPRELSPGRGRGSRGSSGALGPGWLAGVREGGPRPRWRCQSGARAKRACGSASVSEAAVPRGRPPGGASAAGGPRGSPGPRERVPGVLWVPGAGGGPQEGSPVESKAW